jgi:uncharacterized protein (DUF1330 family)
MSCYFIAQIDIEDADEYARYLDRYDQVFNRYAGRVLAVDDDVTVLEGEWPYGRSVVIEFPSEKDLLAWYQSPEYQAIATHRRSASIANIVSVKGRH